MMFWFLLHLWEVPGGFSAAQKSDCDGESPGLQQYDSVSLRRLAAMLNYY